MDFLPEEFDQWVDSYDEDVRREAGFPFNGYARVLEAVFDCAQLKAGQYVLDVGCGTGNLANLFSVAGMRVWGSDFSRRMIETAQKKDPQIAFAVADLRSDLPAGFPQRYDCIVSAYTWHHFPLEEKITLLKSYQNYLNPDGQMVIGDLMFPDHAAKDAAKGQNRDSWDEEYYWIMESDQPVLEKAGLEFVYRQISCCAGVLCFSGKAENNSMR